MTTNLKKFKLLLWKNWILQWSHKYEFFIEIIFPVLFSMLLVMVRTLVHPKHEGVVRYEQSLQLNTLELAQFNLESFSPINFVMLYTPNNSPILDKIMTDAATTLAIKSLPYSSPKEMERDVMDLRYFCGVEFDKSLAHATVAPKKLKFKIRFPAEIRSNISPFYLDWLTNLVFPPEDGVGPRNKDYISGGLPGCYMDEGFLPVQYAISTAFIKQSAQLTKLPKVILQRYPYPAHIDDPLITYTAGMLGMVIVLSYLYPSTCTVKYITMEKEKCLKEVMKIMGLPNWLHWMAWFVKAFGMMAISAFLITIVLTFKWADDVAVLTYSSFTAVYFFLLVYSVATITLCFMLATLFSRARTAAAATGLILIIMFLPVTIFELNYDHISGLTKIAFSAITNTGAGLGLRLICNNEANGDGVHWNNMDAPPSVDDDLSIGIVIFMMLLASVIHMIVCLYMEQIYPGEFGVSKRWNFIFRKKFWAPQRYHRPSIFNPKIERDNPDAFEEEPVGAEIGVQIQSLSKRFGNRMAVNNLSMNMYKNEITVLLGHNGAGKTTTVSMLTGMFSPTSGTAIINGYDIRTNIDGARSSLGICPQHNILFEDMTVRNHLIFYSSLKGLEGKKLRKEVRKYIKKIGLKQKANLASSKLSGGMQRKLSVCCAFCGGTKVVLCDEPSSGMDPSARRQLWDLLQSEKYGRTILLTTHFMDEADTLGDHIAIMSAGDLKCYGTSFFLKKKFGGGYHLICVKKEDCETILVTELLKKYIPGIHPEADIGSELSYKLPDQYSSLFQDMFADLEQNSDALKISGFGVSASSLEEVFMKTGAEVYLQKSNPNPSGIAENLFADNEDLLRGMQLTISQWQAMFFKKYLFTIRNKLIYLIQNLMPILFIAVTIMFGTSYAENLPALPLDLNQFDETVTVLSVTSRVQADTFGDKVAKNYRKIIKSLGSQHKLLDIGSADFTEYMLGLGKKLQPRIDAKYAVAATIDRGKFTAWLNNKPLHTAPVTVNILLNAMAKAAIGPEASISVVNHPLPYTELSQFSLLMSGQSLGTRIATNLSFSMSFIASFYAMFLIKECQSRAKLLQFVGGVRLLTFWFSHYVWDALSLLITTFGILLVFIVCQQQGYSTADELSRYTILITVFCLSVLPMTYLAGTLFLDPASGYAKLVIFYLFCGNAMFLIIIVMKLPLLKTEKVAEFLEDFFIFIPHFALSQGLDNLYVNDAYHAICSNLAKKYERRRLCYGYPMCCDLKAYFGWESPGIMRQITCLFITGIVCFIILILKEYKIISMVWKKIKDYAIHKPLPRRGTLDGYFDEDVEEEKSKVENLTLEELKDHNLVLDGVSKSYGEFRAVNQLFLAVRSSECFGLLGVNGAGKTTTFKMMTGDETITSGGAYVRGYSLKTEMNEVYQRIGYCPQFDALFDEFTAKEQFKIYALLRGIPKDKIEHISTELALGFGVMKHFNKQSGAYSGGNKRKLSTAIAVLGGPSVIYLDEPTTGMDPAARRKLWNMLCAVRDAGKSIILTSHSMEECEALCTRSAIMVNGEFKCLGPTQHLKNKFSQGLVLKIKLKKSSFNLSKSSNRLVESKSMHDSAEKVTANIKGEFVGAYLKERYEGLFTFHIPHKPHLWSQAFGYMESNKESLELEDYSINQTTLEEIFLEFAKYQRDDPREKSGRTRTNVHGGSAMVL